MSGPNFGYGDIVRARNDLSEMGSISNTEPLKDRICAKISEHAHTLNNPDNQINRADTKEEIVLKRSQYAKTFGFSYFSERVSSADKMSGPERAANLCGWLVTGLLHLATKYGTLGCVPWLVGTIAGALSNKTLSEEGDTVRKAANKELVQDALNDLNRDLESQFGNDAVSIYKKKSFLDETHEVHDDLSSKDRLAISKQLRKFKQEALARQPSLEGKESMQILETHIKRLAEGLK